MHTILASLLQQQQEKQIERTKREKASTIICCCCDENETHTRTHENDVLEIFIYMMQWIFVAGWRRVVSNQQPKRRNKQINKQAHEQYGTFR